MNTKRLEDKRLCECGCGNFTNGNARYVYQHHNKGKHWKLSEQTKIRMGLAKLSINNPNWKGDNVGYIPLHIYVKKRLPKPKFCEYCNKITPYDLANVTGIYNRNLENWKWLCRRCHMNTDGRMMNLKQFQ